MSDDTIRISGTAINKLHNDDYNTRTIEIKVGDYDANPRVRLTGTFQVVLDLEGESPRLRLQDESGTIGYVELKSE